jgi:V8-like Glu-specific endopeptidase
LLGSTKMRAWISGSQGPAETPIDDAHFRICPEYVQSPDQKIHDYGAIVLPKAGRPGFGFNLRFASQGLGEKGTTWDQLSDKVVPVDNSGLQVHITGYKGATAGKPFEGQGLLITKGNERLRPDQLEYAIETAEGVSGSPVWKVDKGGESVVAIQ